MNNNNNNNNNNKSAWTNWDVIGHFQTQGEDVNRPNGVVRKRQQVWLQDIGRIYRVLTAAYD
jgi:hypothetical protein